MTTTSRHSHYAGRYKLSEQQRRFAHEYCIDCSGYAAARRAGYSESSARVAHKLLEHPHIRRIINHKLNTKLRKIDINAERVLQETAAIAFADAGEAYDAEGKLKPYHEWPEELRRAFTAEFGVNAEGFPVVRYKQTEKKPALEMLAKQLNMAAGKSDNPLADLIAEIGDRYVAQGQTGVSPLLPRPDEALTLDDTQEIPADIIDVEPDPVPAPAE